MKISTALAASIASLALSGSVFASTIQWATVGDINNVADNTGFGAVSHEFKIMKFEFTNSDYVTFLNAVDQAGSNTRSLYAPAMSTSLRGGIDFVPGNPNGSKYVVKADFGAKPVNNVSWWDAARVANWMHNGQGIGASTETGAYTLNGAITGVTPVKESGALYWIPSENEWYKAAYYKGGSTNAGYWEYATQSETLPTKVTASAQGVGSAGPVGNFANFGVEADWNGANGNVTSVGTNGGPSAYGAYDMTGNVAEIVGLGASSSIARMGGHLTTDPSALGATNAATVAISFNATDFAGFRLATGVPEPGSTLPILTLFGLALSKGRRRKA